MPTIGYARVSTDGQTLDAQQAALTAAGCAKVFAERPIELNRQDKRGSQAGASERRAVWA